MKNYLPILIFFLAACKSKFVNEYWEDGSIKQLVQKQAIRENDSLLVIKSFPKNTTDTAKNYIISKYYQSGKIQSKGAIARGAKHGFWQYWFENGNKCAEENYYYGRNVGNYISWYPDGEVLEKFYFK